MSFIFHFVLLTVGAADSPVTGTVTPTNDMATQKNAQAVLKAPSSQPSAVSSDTAAPPNLDEQKRHQVRLFFSLCPVDNIWCATNKF